MKWLIAVDLENSSQPWLTSAVAYVESHPELAVRVKMHAFYKRGYREITGKLPDETPFLTYQEAPSEEPQAADLRLVIATYMVISQNTAIYDRVLLVSGGDKRYAAFATELQSLKFNLTVSLVNAVRQPLSSFDLISKELNNPVPKRVECPDCTKSFQYRPAMEQHQKSKHAKAKAAPKMNSQNERNIPCFYCNKYVGKCSFIQIRFMKCLANFNHF